MCWCKAVRGGGKGGIVHTCWDLCAGARLFEEECVVGVACWVLLRLEQRVKVPERRLDVSTGGHLFETHLEEHVAAFLQQRSEENQRMSMRIDLGLEFL